MNRRWGVSALVSLLAGCAWPALNEDEAARVARSKIWVATYFPFQRFPVREALLRPYGWQHATNVNASTSCCGSR